MTAMKNKSILIFVITCLFVTLLGHTFASEANFFTLTTVHPIERVNTVIDKKATDKLFFRITDLTQEIYFNNNKVEFNNIDKTFSIDISNLQGEQNIEFKNASGDSISFKYYLSDDEGKVENFELVKGKQLNVFVTTYKNIKILYTDKEKNAVTKLLLLLQQLPDNTLINLHQIQMIPYDNTSNIAGTTKEDKIILYKFSKYSTTTQKNILFHETAHTWANKLIDNSIIDFDYTNYKAYVLKDNNFVSNYSKNFTKDNGGKLSEDFAESFAFYFMNKESFTKKYPNRTEYLLSLLNKEP